MKSPFTQKFLSSLIIIFTIAWNPTCKSQSSTIHEVKSGFFGSYYVENLGLLYEIIPRKQWGYELGIVPYKSLFMFTCPDGYCDSPDEDENLQPHYLRAWAFTFSLKYYLSKKHQASRWYAGAFLLYSVEVAGKKLRARYQDQSSIDSYLQLSRNRVSPGGILGYKWQIGQHLLIEPSLSMSINLANLGNMSVEREFLFLGRIGWCF